MASAPPAPGSYFFYGSLMRGKLNHHCLDSFFGPGGIAFVSRGRTLDAGHLLGLRSRAYPYLTFAVPLPAAASRPHRVVGEVYEVVPGPGAARGLVLLDRLEDGYALRELEVELLPSDGGDAPPTRRCLVYVLEDASELALLWASLEAGKVFAVDSGDWGPVGLSATGRGGDSEEVVPNDG